MSMGRESDRQGDLIVTWSEMPRSPGHVFYDRLQEVLLAGGFYLFVETVDPGFVVLLVPFSYRAFGSVPKSDEPPAIPRRRGDIQDRRARPEPAFLQRLQARYQAANNLSFRRW